MLTLIGYIVAVSVALAEGQTLERMRHKNNADDAIVLYVQVHWMRQNMLERSCKVTNIKVW